MLFTGRRICRAILLSLCVGFAGCSFSEPVAAPVASSATTVVVVDDVEATQPTTGSVEGEEAAPIAAEPLRPAGEPQATSVPDVETTSAYISRLSMGSDTVEVHWSDSDGVAEYHIHRIPRRSDDEPPVESMTTDNLIHVAESGGRFADLNVEGGVEYWHGVREFSAAGVLMAHGWHKTAAIDDEIPPSVVDGISAVLENGEVLVTWDEPDENYQLHGYRILRGIDGEPSEPIAVTWRLDQRSFLDDEPPVSAVVVYEVVAFDFHWNASSPGGVTIDLS